MLIIGSTINCSDVVYVVKEEYVVETGSDEDLLENREGTSRWFKLSCEGFVRVIARDR